MASLGGPVCRAAGTITDLAGRQQPLAALPRRIVLLEARDILTMALLHPDPARLVVGWAAADRIDSAELQARYERQGRIPAVGKQTAATVSLEGILALAPDLVVASAFMAPEGGTLLRGLQQAGIPVVFSDVASNAAAPQASPIDNLHRQLRMWGDILGEPERAQAYIAFADQHLQHVRQRLAGVEPVTAYLEVQSTVDDCCWAAGTQVWGELLTLAGGRILPGITAPWYQKLQLEYLLSAPQEVYIASGGGWASGGRPAIGPGMDSAQGRAGLQGLLKRPGFAQLSSVRQGRVHGIWTGLITLAPLNILFVEVAAKWLHPDVFADLDPSQTLADINRRFLAEPMRGPLWLSLKE
ncbi:ABC transporter substrate-binding protein [Bordetella genomosp. 12]|uniref:ABC transporter substrate-binding protein n=1 Tax=Bordetella genomosp. 12 TaxID=463035 RepID=A0A261VMD7_9BORD|nr:ABC transporter substrate-binding protein [Bordetella genomosp. 12]